MKHLAILLLILVLALSRLSAQTAVSGTVTVGSEPLAGANVFILGTVEGSLTDSLGRFSFTTAQRGVVTLRATFVGFDDYSLTADVTQMRHLRIALHERAATIDEVCVSASTYSFGKSDNFKTMDALDVVLSGNACGDIVAALQTLPGTQMVGEDGKLYVRGGESSECQTFVNGMHVLVPYSTQTENTAVRGRFSPFLFKGINFSLGGYSGEYGQALSAVLPMETTDRATSDKYGVSASLVDWNIGGTRVGTHNSLSFNAALTDLRLYDRLFPQRYEFHQPYRLLAAEGQYKHEFSASSVLKSYVGADWTTVGQRLEGRDLSLTEKNGYANLTHRTTLSHGITLFAGLAHSVVVRDIDQALTPGDHLHNFRNETHLKFEYRQVCNEVLKVSAGIEDYLRHSTLTLQPQHYTLDYNLLAAHADVQWRIVPHLFLQGSLRAEQLRRNLILLPRATLSYIPGRQWQFSLVAGRYSQLAEDDVMAQSLSAYRQALSDHLIGSLQFRTSSTLVRVEPYAKRYRRLPLLRDQLYRAEGHGTSRGIDLFVEDHSLSSSLSLTASYSYNDARRLYLDYSASRTPEFASRHNLRLSAKYSWGKTIWGLTESLASGRHFPMGTTPFYNSVDGSLTYLWHPRVILHLSCSNLLGRTNIFRYTPQGQAITASRDHFIYLGIFVSLKNNKAYEISNF